MLNQISGGVCAAKGFTAAGVHCGVKAGSSPDKNDLALILSEKECAAAATYTTPQATPFSRWSMVTYRGAAFTRFMV